MKVLILLAAACIFYSESALLESSQEQEIKIYKARNRVLYSKLERECPAYVKSERSVPVDHISRLKVEELLYEDLLQKLIECRSELGDLDVATKPSTEPSPSTTPATTTTELPTTTLPVVPPECNTATVFTESWRQDHQGTKILPYRFLSYLHPYSIGGQACDFRNGIQWFKFAGAAGTHMLDHCPKQFSCGTATPYWTDEKMPDQVGVVKTVKAYGVSGIFIDDCKYFHRDIQVMKCSDKPNDFIYKQSTNYLSTCNQAFCGMM